MFARANLNIEDLAAPFIALGSREVKRHVAVVMDNALAQNQKGFQQVLRETLGSKVQGPHGMIGRFGEPSAYVLGAVRKSNIDFDKITDDTPDDKVTGRVYVADTQGKVGSDQSAILKYGFGQGDSTREPGDVGMAADRILIPQNDALFASQRLNVNPYYNGGRQLPGLLRILQHRAERGRGSDDLDSALRGTDGPSSRASKTNAARSAAMKRYPGEAFEAQTRGLGHRSHVDALYGLGPGAFDEAAVRERRRQSLVPRDEFGMPGRDIAPEAVFEGPDRKSGLGTFYSRPIRVRDPAGGTHQVVGRNGKVSKYPNMLNLRRDTGEAGPKVGPSALLLARRNARYSNKLQGPWDRNNEITADNLARHLEDEVQHILRERIPQGRSY